MDIFLYARHANAMSFNIYLDASELCCRLSLESVTNLRPDFWCQWDVVEALLGCKLGFTYSGVKTVFEPFLVSFFSFLLNWHLGVIGIALRTRWTPGQLRSKIGDIQLVGIVLAQSHSMWCWTHVWSREVLWDLLSDFWMLVSEIRLCVVASDVHHTFHNSSCFS